MFMSRPYALVEHDNTQHAHCVRRTSEKALQCPHHSQKGSLVVSESKKIFTLLIIALSVVFSTVSVQAQVGTPETSQPAADTPVVAANTAEPPASAPKSPAPTAPAPQAEAPTSPLQIHIGDATLTPVAFMDLTNTFRSTNSGASLATNFGNFPYSNAVPTGFLTEDRFSAQNSRIGFRVDAKVKGANVLGYYEGDFVGGVGASGIAPALNTQV